MKARRAVDAVAIEERERRIAEGRGAFDERFGERGAVEKGKGRCGMQFDIHAVLVVDAFEEPPVRRVVLKDAADDTALQRDVPLTAMPRVIRPPAAG